MRFPRSALGILAYRRWPQTILFIVGGMTVGMAAVVVAWLSDRAQLLFQGLIGVWPMLPLVLTPVGFAAITFVTGRLAPGAGGSGIPQVIAAHATRDDAFRATLVSFRIAISKILLLPVGLAIGASIGREGPTVQIGASILYGFSRLSPRFQPGLLAAGAGAGVAAAFNTPLAGVMFALEELSRTLETRSLGFIILIVATAGLTSYALLGHYAYFGTTAAALGPWRDWVAVPLIGCVGGAAGALFCQILVAGVRSLPTAARRFVEKHPILFSFSCGLAVAIVGLVAGNATFGTGYTQAFAMIHQQSPADWTFAPLKFLATLISALSGIPGGIFAPSLAIGAGIGIEMAPLVPSAPIAALALLGMVAFLTGVVQAPLTAVIIVAEMSENHAMVIPLMAVALTANWIARLISRHGFYHRQASAIIRRHRRAMATA